MASLLKSRKFWLSIFAVVEVVVFHYLQVPDAVWQTITVLVMWLIGMIAVEDAAAKLAGRK